MRSRHSKSHLLQVLQFALSIQISFILLSLPDCCLAHVHKYRTRTRSRASPAAQHSALPLIAEQPVVAAASGGASAAGIGAQPGSSSTAASIECDFLNFKQTGCEDENGSECDSQTSKCVCKTTHPVRLLDFCLPVSRLNGPCYTSGQCANVLNASCYIFGKEYDLETASGGHNLGRMVKNWPLGICKCRLGFAYNEGSGICEKRLVGSWCSNDKHCLLRSLNSICDKKLGECECSWGTSYDAKLDACIPTPIKPPTKQIPGLPSGGSLPGNNKVSLYEPAISRSPYLMKCEHDADCDWPAAAASLHGERALHGARHLQRTSSSANITNTARKAPLASSLTSKVGSGHESADQSTAASRVAPDSRAVNSISKTEPRLARLQCVRGRCICGASLVWEAGACRLEAWSDSNEIVTHSGNSSTHKNGGRKTDDNLEEDLDDGTITWQTIISMSIFCFVIAGFVFRFCFYRKSEEDELAEDIRTAEALFAHKAGLGPQHPFNALTAAFLSKPATHSTVTPTCNGGHKAAPFGFHGSAGCYHHELGYPYNYNLCGSMIMPSNAQQLPPPLNEQDEDEYLRLEAEEAASGQNENGHCAEIVPRDGGSKSDDSCEIRSGSADSSNDAQQTSTLGAVDSSCNRINCAPNSCCGCDCMMVVAPTNPAIMNDCCAANITTPCSSTCGLLAAHSLDMKLAADSTRDLQSTVNGSGGDKSVKNELDENEDIDVDEAEGIFNEQYDDEKMAILGGPESGNAIASSSSLGRSLCSTAGMMIGLGQLTSSARSANAGNAERKSNRRSSTCSSSSASLLNCSSSSECPTSATSVASGNSSGRESVITPGSGTSNNIAAAATTTTTTTSAAPKPAEAVQLVVFKNHQDNTPA